MESRFVSVSEIASRWNISQCRVGVLCAGDRIEGATKVGNSCRIPCEAVKLFDARCKESKEPKAKPFIKWAGGKSRISKEIAETFPEFGCYYEPFLGSGAVYFEIAPQIGVLNDSNVNLINTYRQIKTHPEELIDEMTVIQNEYNNLETDDDKKSYYYDLRDEYNARLQDARKSALFIFLNKAGWNGMYRENSKGLFNIPFGKRKCLNLFDRDNIIRISRNIQGIDFISGDYRDAVCNAKAGDLVYFDPPYFDTFSDYQKDGFTEENQKELHDLAKTLSDLGCYVAVSNSDCEKTRSLYDDFPNIKEISINRTIGSKVDSRKRINELLITNF